MSKPKYPYVGLPNGQKAQIKNSETVQIKPNLKICDILHVPSFNMNFLSVSKMRKDINCPLTF